MAPVQDVCDFLAGEVLGEMAGNFFGRRKSLENLIDLVFTYAEALRRQAALVDSRAGFLAHLLLEPKAAASFYVAIGVQAPQALMIEGFDRRALPDRFPSALFTADRFRKLFKWAYGALAKTCDEYLHGPADCDTGPDREADPDILASYTLVIKLAERANEEVCRINQEVSPSAVLQSARKLGPLGPYRRQSEEFSPGVACAGFDQKFAFSTVDIQSLSLKAYPELPTAESVAPQIADFCKHFYRTHRQPVREMLAALDNRIRRHQNR